MSIITLNNLNFNNETIRISPERGFVFKNGICTDRANSLEKLIKKYSLEKIEIDENNNDFLKNSYYGLMSVDSFQQEFNQSNIKEIEGTTQKKGHSNEKNVYNHVLMTNSNNQDCLESNPVSKPTLNYLNEELKGDFIKSRYFGIKRLQQELKPFSKTLGKKKIIKNLYERNSTKDSLLNQYFNYGFFNYNCLNFFNILPSSYISNYNDIKNIFLENSHNCSLIYSNKKINDKNLYPINNSMSINFWINPKRTSCQNYYYNPGCILHIPNVVSIWLIEDVLSRNQLGQPESFFIRIKLLDDANSQKLSTEDFSSLPRSEGSYTYTSTLKLSLNNWHNVSVIVNSNALKIYVDKNFEILENDSQFIFSSNIENIFTIGNKINDIDTDINFKKSWFDQGNPAIYFLNQHTFKKFGLKENQIIKNDLTEQNYNSFIGGPEGSSFINKKIYRYQNLEISTQTDESFALNAELHNLIVVNTEIDFIDLYDFATGKNYDILNNEHTSFYLPCIYLPDMIYKQGYITLGEINNISHRSFVNPVFAHKIYGHEMSVEHFVKDLISDRRPYITGMNGIEYQNIFTRFESNNNYPLKKDILKDFYKKGRTINQVFNKYVQSGGILKDSVFNKNLFLNGNIVYRNNFIMPCDNGLCNLNLQEYFIKNGLLKNEYSSFLYDNSIHMINSSKLFFENEEDSTSASSDFQKPKEFLQSNAFRIYLLKSFNTTGILLRRQPADNLTLEEVLFNNTSNFSLEKNVYGLNYDIFSNSGENQIFSKIKNITDGTKKIVINSIFKDIDSKTNESLVLLRRNLSNSKIDTFSNLNYYEIPQIEYKKYFNSHLSIEGEDNEIHSIIFDISKSLYSNKIRKNHLTIEDVDISGTGGALNIKIKDNNGFLYRADCLTPHAKWNYIGHVFYNDGLAIINHPGLYSFGENNFSCELKGDYHLNTFEVNIPVEKGDLNYSLNKTYKKLRPSSGLYDTDEEGFVYITGVNLHDENLNIVARANFAQPIVKRQNDRYNVRLKMDY